MTQQELTEVAKFCYSKGFADRRTPTTTRGMKRKVGRMELFITIVPCSNSIFYSSALPLHCFGRTGMRYVNNAQYAIQVINALVTRFERALLSVKKKYKIK